MTATATTAAPTLVWTDEDHGSKRATHAHAYARVSAHGDRALLTVGNHGRHLFTTEHESQAEALTVGETVLLEMAPEPVEYRRVTLTEGADRVVLLDEDGTLVAEHVFPRTLGRALRESEKAVSAMVALRDEHPGTSVFVEVRTDAPPAFINRRPHLTLSPHRGSFTTVACTWCNTSVDGIYPDTIKGRAQAQAAADEHSARHYSTGARNLFVERIAPVFTGYREDRAAITERRLAVAALRKRVGLTEIPFEQIEAEGNAVMVAPHTLDWETYFVRLDGETDYGHTASIVVDEVTYTVDGVEKTASIIQSRRNH
jgi:hypothetical protein